MEFKYVLRKQVPNIVERLMTRRSSGTNEHESPEFREVLIDDVARFVEFALAAVSMRRSSVFVDYVDWARSLQLARQQSTTELLAMLEEIRAEISPSESSDVKFLLTTLDLAAHRMNSADRYVATSIQRDSSAATNLAQRYLDLLLESKRAVAINLIMKSLDEGLALEDLYMNVLQPVMHEVGRRWQSNEISVAQEHYVSAVTQLLVSQIYPRLLAGPRNGKTLIAACVVSNLHEIGLRFLCDIFELRGWDTHFYGANTPVEEVIDVVRQRQPHIVAIGATLGLQLPAVAAFVQAMKFDPMVAQVPILVGGSAFAGHGDLWKEMGADGYARDALHALEIANELTAKVH